MPKVLTEALDNAGMGFEDVDWLLLHQVTVGAALASLACFVVVLVCAPVLSFGSVGPPRGGKGHFFCCCLIVGLTGGKEGQAGRQAGAFRRAEPPSIPGMHVYPAVVFDRAWR